MFLFLTLALSYTATFLLTWQNICKQEMSGHFKKFINS